MPAPKHLYVRINDAIRVIRQDDYDRIIAWMSKPNSKGELETDWPLAFEAMEHRSVKVADISQEEKDEEQLVG